MLQSYSQTELAVELGADSPSVLPDEIYPKRPAVQNNMTNRTGCCGLIACVSVLAIVVAGALFVESRLRRGAANDELYNPFPYYHFPVVLNAAVRFDEARDECAKRDGYTLAGLESANKKYLEDTVQLLDSIDTPAVWMGGYFNFSSDEPFLIHWADGRVSDLEKSPPDIWCRHPLNSLSPLLGGTTSIVPIVRLKSDPLCLSALPPTSIMMALELRPFCARKTADLFFEKPSGKVLVPSFFSGIADTANKGIYDMYSKVKCIEDGRCVDAELLRKRQPIVYHDRQANPLPSFLLVGFSELVNYDSARAICSHVHFGKQRSINGLIGREILNDRNNIAKHSRALFSSLSNIAEPVVTSGFFEFGPDSQGYAKLHWGTTIVESLLDVALDWCDSPENITNFLTETYQQFRDWYGTVGHLTSGPYRVHVALSVKRDEEAVCLRLVTDDLYWPGFHSWLPVCHVNP